MSNDWFQDVTDFCTKVRHDKVPNFPAVAHPFHQQLARKLIKEEIKELLHAITMNNLAAIADGGVDSIVVILGAMIYYGIDIRPIWDIIHKTNMAKAGGRFNPDGKLLKPEGWVGPDIAGEIRRQIANLNTTVAPSDKGN